MYVRDLDGVEYVVQTSPTQSYELNSNITLKATILPTKANKAFIEDIAEMWSIFDFDDVEHRILFVDRRGKGDKQYVEIQAIPKFFDVLDNDRIYKEYNEHMTAKVAFDRIFDNLPFTYRFVDTFYAVEWEGFGAGESKLETFSRAIERYKAEFRIVGNVVYLETKIGRDTQFMYRHGLNASNISVQTDAKEMWTIARGYGDFEDGEESENGGWQNAKLERTYISPLAQIPSIGHRHAPPIKNGTIKVNSTMDAQLKLLVDESVKVSVTADLHDLRKQGYPLAQPELGDRVFLIDDRIGFNEEVRVVSITVTKNWRGDIEDLELTFGELGISQRYKSGLSTATKNILDLFEGRKKLPFHAYDAAVQQASKDLKNARTELYFPDEGGIWAVEKTNPNYLTRLTSKGLGVSDDGGASFRTAVTGRGVVAEEIIGKIIIGTNLLIENEKSTFVVDGDGVTLDGAAMRITNGLKDSEIRSSDKWNAQGTYIDSTGVYTGRLNANQVQIGQFGDELIESAEQWNGQGTYIDDTGVYTGRLNASQIQIGKFSDEFIESADQWNGQGTYIDDSGIYTGRLNASQIQVGKIKDNYIESADQWNGQGTYIDDSGIYTGTLTANQVRVGFNGIASNTKIVSTGLETYDGSSLLSKLSSTGHEFYRGGRTVGSIGTAEDMTGGIPSLSIQLEDGNRGLFFGKKDSSNPLLFEPKFSWTPRGVGYAGRSGFQFLDNVHLVGDVKVDSRVKFEVDSDLDVNGDINIGNGGFLRRTSNSIRLAVNESTYINMNQNGIITFVSNGNVFEIFTP